MKYFSLLLMFFTLRITALHAEASVVDAVKISPSILASKTLSGGYRNLLVESSTNAGTTSAIPYNVYLPVTSTAIVAPTPDPSDYTTWDISATPLPLYEDSNGYLKFNLVVSNDTGSDKYLVVVANNLATSMKKINLVEGSIVVPSGTSASTLSVTLHIENICKSTGSTCAFASAPDSRYLYFFLASSDPAAGSEPSIADTVGVYYRIFISQNLNEFAPTITPFAPGDGRLKTSITAMAEINYPHLTYSLIFPADSSTTLTYQDALAAGATVLNQGEGSIKGTFWVKPLVNDITYNIAVAYVDKFGFATLVSASEEGTPRKVDAFLEQTSCYLLSAGFKHDHFVLNYFRDFRDMTLVKNNYGLAFVRGYYKWAPIWSGYIYRSITLSFLVRVMAYILYFFLRWKILVALSSLIVIGLYWKRVKKNLALSQ